MRIRFQGKEMGAHADVLLCPAERKEIKEILLALRLPFPLFPSFLRDLKKLRENYDYYGHSFPRKEETNGGILKKRMWIMCIIWATNMNNNYSLKLESIRAHSFPPKKRMAVSFWKRMCIMWIILFTNMNNNYSLKLECIRAHSFPKKEAAFVSKKK